MSWEHGDSGKPYTGLGWLRDHHEAKAEARRQQVADLDLRSGDAVLDLGCGPGFWLPLLAERVGSGGRVVGLDGDPGLVAYARSQFAGAEPAGSAAPIEVQQGAFEALPFEDETFDAIFFGGGLSYALDPGPLLAEQMRVLRAGGRLMVKDYDGDLLVLHPMEPALLSAVLAGSARRMAEDPPTLFDNYPGRKLHGLLLRAGLRGVQTRSYAIQLVAPLSPAAERHVLGNAEWYGEMADPYLTPAQRSAWTARFDPKSPAYALADPGFFFCMVEMVATGTK